MAAVKSTESLIFIVSVGLLVFVSAEQRNITESWKNSSLLCPDVNHKNITAELGCDVSLPCRAPGDGPINAVEWIRPDLESKYVFLCRDGHIDPNNQHPCFYNRVDLQDRDMKYGNVSLILKNVTTDDTGTYVCRVRKGTKGNRQFLHNDPISIIHLEVSPAGSTNDPGDKDGSARLAAGLTVGLPAFLYLLL